MSKDNISARDLRGLSSFDSPLEVDEVDPKVGVEVAAEVTVFGVFRGGAGLASWTVSNLRFLDSDLDFFVVPAAVVFFFGM